MADKKNVTLAQLAEFARKADARLDDLELGKENKVSPVSITIPAEGWAAETDEAMASYPFYYDIAAESVTAKDRVDIAIAPGSMDTAIDCGLCPTNETQAGKIRVWARTVPAGAISAEYRLSQGKE